MWARMHDGIQEKTGGVLSITEMAYPAPLNFPRLTNTECLMHKNWFTQNEYCDLQRDAFFFFF